METKPTVVVEAAKPYTMKGRQESASSAPPLDESHTNLADDTKKRSTASLPKFEQAIVPWYNPKTISIQILFAIICALVTAGVVITNQVTGTLEGQFITCIITMFGGSLTIYHGLLDGPLRDSKTGLHLPTWRYILQGSLCGILTTCNVAACVYGHKSLIIYKIIVTAACGVAAVVYILCGLWFLAPIPFLCAMMIITHFEAFVFYIFARMFPLWMPYAVMLTNMGQASLYGWSNRVHLDDVGSVHWASVICPLIQAYRRVAFVQIIATQSWEWKIFMIISNIFNAMLTPDVKTILYTALGMKVEVYDVNAMHMLDSLSWAADVKFLLMMPFLLAFGEWFGIEGGDVWPMFRENFGLVLGMYILQFTLCELAIFGMAWANKFVNLKQPAGQRQSVLQIGAQQGTGRYYYSQLHEDMAYFHPFLPIAIEFLQTSFTYFGIEDLYKL